MIKNCCGVNYPEQDILIRDNVRLIIDLPNYATKQN